MAAGVILGMVILISALNATVLLIELVRSQWVSVAASFSVAISIGIWLCWTRLVQEYPSIKFAAKYLIGLRITPRPVSDFQLKMHSYLIIPNSKLAINDKITLSAAEIPNKIISKSFGQPAFLFVLTESHVSEVGKVCKDIGKLYPRSEVGFINALEEGPLINALNMHLTMEQAKDGEMSERCTIDYRPVILASPSLVVFLDGNPQFWYADFSDSPSKAVEFLAQKIPKSFVSNRDFSTWIDEIHCAAA